MKKILQYKLPERFSTKVLYLLSALIVVVFALFWLVGYNRSFDDDPNFNAPLFTNALLVLMLLMLIAGVAAVVWSMVKAFKTTGDKQNRFNNIPYRRIQSIVAIGTLALMVLTFALGSSSPMPINGVSFTDAFWLKASDMFILTSGLLIVAAIVAVVFGATKYSRKL